MVLLESVHNRTGIPSFTKLTWTYSQEKMYSINCAVISQHPQCCCWASTLFAEQVSLPTDDNKIYELPTQSFQDSVLVSYLTDCFFYQAVQDRPCQKKMMLWWVFNNLHLPCCIYYQCSVTNKFRKREISLSLGHRVGAFIISDLRLIQYNIDWGENLALIISIWLNVNNLWITKTIPKPNLFLFKLHVSCFLYLIQAERQNINSISK